MYGYGGLWYFVWKTLDWEKRGGGNTECTLKNCFGTIPYFLEIADVGEADLLFEIISVLPKVYSTQIENTNVFWQNTNVFCHQTTLHLCFAIRLTIVSHLVALSCK